ncbi:hypothetical protein [Mycobacterium servetii]|uniref:Uncharacterized protein n=1 Tax=Mycobacterium servetii TaxID=3237418 RepID=A0ABV4C982_9MYCO
MSATRTAMEKTPSPCSARNSATALPRPASVSRGLTNSTPPAQSIDPKPQFGQFEDPSSVKNAAAASSRSGATA